MKTLVSGNTAFAVDLYQQLKDQPGNLFFSPHSISTALGMTYAGARGETEAEIAKALHFDLPQNSLHAAFGDLNSRLNSIQRWNRITVKAANLLCYQSGSSVLPSFTDLLREKYRAEALPLDFAHDAQGASRQINQWVRERTREKIKGFTTPGDSEHARASLLSVIYFKGKWKFQFDPSETKTSSFQINDTNQVLVPMMGRTAEIKGLRLETVPVDLVELPYYGEDLSLIILLPRIERIVGVDTPTISLSELETILTAQNLQAWLTELGQMQTRDCHIRIPRFNISQRMSLVTCLKELGVTTLFSLDADLTAMSSHRDLFISDVIHQACVEVNEEGTEAAAAISMYATAGIGDSFVADHPFIFLIRDNAARTILFFGRVVDPTKQ